MNTKISTLLLLSILLVSTFALAIATNLTATAQIVDAPSLDGSTIPKFTDQLVIPPVYVPNNIYDCNGKLIRQEYTVKMSSFYQQILPAGYPATQVFGYGGYVKDAITGKWLGFVSNSPGPTFEAIRGVPVRVKWVNNLQTSFLPIDPTLHWADPNNLGMMNMDESNVYDTFPPGYADAQTPVPTAVHLHGAEVSSSFDGGPDQWFTANGIHGTGYRSLYPTAPNAAVYEYPNTQIAYTSFYHDHALGMTRINVMSGLAGIYLLRDKNTYRDYVAPLLPKGKYEIPLAIQDRSFNDDGSLWFPSVGNNPDIHPYWQPEFFGDTIMVNGKLWPNLNVDRGQYRFRIVDGSNARFYNLQFVVQGTGQVLPFKLIGTDGGYIKTAVNLNSLLIAPGQRDDILVDFSGIAPGTKILMTNNANAPYPDGDPVDPDTTAQIMQFTVTANAGYTPKTLPTLLNPTLKYSYPNLHDPVKTRTLPFFEAMSAIDEPLAVYLNGQMWSGVLTETPRVGATEDWYLVNPTADAHPIHTHLTQFQLVKRIPFDWMQYEADWIALNGMPPVPENVVPTKLAVTPYFTGPAIYPTADENAWRDTIIAPPGYVTVIRIRWAPQDSPLYGTYAPKPGVNQFPFNPTKGPGYVWHCHIIDHEDNEMMRPYKVVW